MHAVAKKLAISLVSKRLLVYVHVIHVHVHRRKIAKLNAQQSLHVALHRKQLLQNKKVYKKSMPEKIGHFFVEKDDANRAPFCNGLFAIE